MLITLVIPLMRRENLIQKSLSIKMISMFVQLVTTYGSAS